METSSYFYVLHCKDGSLYGGYTTDLKRRLEEHNQGTGAKYTRPKTRRPVQMIYAEEYWTRSEATKAEYAFKQLDRRRKDRFLKQHGVKKPFGRIKQPVVQDKREEPQDEQPKEL